MTPTTINVFQEAVQRGLTLSPAGDDKLHVAPAKRCPSDFADVLRAHKKNLMSLLHLPFVMAHSEALGETIFFVRDEDTRRALVEAGAAPGMIYRRDELQILVKANRCAPFTAAELLPIHDAKQLFNGRLTE
jgi:hypothetical protein